jgi:lipopolysaccharide transport system ATP-binding protein
MNDEIIQIDHLSKRYRIGMRETGYRTFREVLIDGVMSPLRNFKRLRRLTNFEDTDSEAAARSSLVSQGTESTPDDVIWALRDVSFNVKRGEVVGIIGRNGAGKSTLLKILSRVTEPTAGTVDLYGRISSLLEVGTGFHPELTGRENIFLNGAILGMRKTEITQKFDEIVAFADIEKFIDTPVKRYSSGMYVRLAFAVAAHLEPEILIVDEVLAVGDVAFQKKCMGKMSDVAKEGRTVLLVSHNMAAIRNLCSRSILLDEGKIIADDVTARVIDRYLSQKTIEMAVASREEIEARMEGVILKRDPHIRCLELSLSDKTGEPKLSFYSDESIFVRIKLRCLKTVYNLGAILHLTDEKDNLLLLTQNIDDPEMMDGYNRLDEGVYEFVCEIPPNLFGSKKFYLSVNLEFPKKEHLVIPRIIGFEVKFNGYNGIHHDYPFFFRPQFKWQMQKLMTECPNDAQ